MSSVGSDNNHAEVHIWETKVGDEDGNGTTVGHASIKLQGEGNGRYFSFRPRNPVYVNPLLFWLPTTGKSLSTVDQDIKHEGKAPDRTIRVTLTQTQMKAASEKVDQLKEEAEKGTLLYHLFPRVSVVEPIKLLATKTGQEELSKCPFSGQKMGDDRYKRLEGMQKVRSGHCSSTVHEVLNAAEGVELPPHSVAPWLVTPSTLGDDVDELTKAHH